LQTPIMHIKGVGPKRAQLLEQMGIRTRGDLLSYIPRAYKDMSNHKRISSLAPGEEALFVASVAAEPRLSRAPGRRLQVLRVQLEDETGKVDAVWFNRPYLKKTLRPGTKWRFFGKLDTRMGRIVQSPVVEPVTDESAADDALQPVYTLPKGLAQKTMRGIVREALATLESIYDPFDEQIRRDHTLCGREFALWQIHFPDNMDSCRKAKRRLAFEELLYYQLALRTFRNARTQENRAPYIQADMAQVDELLASLPFELTQSQILTVGEVIDDLAGEYPMARIVQGDVGCGKTVVAAIALFITAKSGKQGIIMAPTETLAQQHYQSLRQMLEPFGITVGLLTGSLTAAQKRKAQKEIESGAWQVAVGTQALIQKAVKARDLALVVTDEQHRFGVRQRLALEDKGESPHVLVMSATPIPRTLSLILYGDLDVSVINEMPAGRLPVQTRIVPEWRRDDMYRFVRDQVEGGKQAFIICPLVDDSDIIDARSAQEVYHELSRGLLSQVNMGLVHGRMSAIRKKEHLDAFRRGDVSVLVTTSMVEVGVDVPGATTIIIEDAARFGLAQLHQMRGRVGRGGGQSWCFLVAGGTRDAASRLDIMRSTHNGFVVAEKDLELRGPGDVLGTRQHGVLDPVIAKLTGDLELVKETRDAVQYVLQRDDNASQQIRYEAMVRFQDRLKDVSFS
jgi:ATP-dependent DNA helicase RecG